MFKPREDNLSKISHENSQDISEPGYSAVGERVDTADERSVSNSQIEYVNGNGVTLHQNCQNNRNQSR